MNLLSDFSTKKILVVEDDEDNRKAILSILEYVGGYTNIKTAKNGVDALMLTQSFEPDLILMDLLLPKMDGWEAASRIKGRPEYRHIPIVAVTAHAMYGQEKKALKSGCDDYITKPIDVHTLLNKVDKYLKGKSIP